MEGRYSPAFGRAPAALARPAGRGNPPWPPKVPPGGGGVELLLGRAGTGKTETCLHEALSDLTATGPDGPPLVLLAPEQATYQLERALLQRLPAGAALVRLEVLSFGRLARRILAECGGLVRQRVAESGRRMLLHALLQRERDRLRAFGRSADRRGLTAALARQLDEFEAYALEPADLAARAERAPAGTADRLADLVLLWEAYRARTGGGLGQPGSELAAAAAAAAGSSLAGARIWVDGFSGFTPREEGLLAALLAAGAGLTVALCLDGREWRAAPPPEEEDPAHPFAPTRRTLRRLLALAPTAALRVLDGGHAPTRFRPGGSLARLEAGLWAERADPPAALSGPGEPAVRSAAFADARAEVEATADEIDRLCRERGYRHREIAVIVRDMESYHHLLGPAFAARGIPVFIDRRRPLRGHPAPAVLSAALRLAVEDWSAAAVRHYLHQDLCGLPRDWADRLENLALASGLTGRLWHAREVGWEAEAERLRLQLVRPPLALQQALRTSPPAQAAAAAGGRFLAAVAAEPRIEAWAAQAEAAGRPEDAAWHRQGLAATDELLEQLALTLRDEPLGAPDMLAALQAGLEELTVGLVPPRLDQVLCGAVQRSRHPEIRAAFVLGMGEGAFPPSPPESPLLGDTDRRALRRLGVELAPTSDEHLLAERYLGYIALTRASERLYLSHPEGAGAAETLRRAQIVAGAAAWGGHPGPTARAGAAPLAAALAVHLRAARDGGPALPPEWAAAEDWLDATPETAPFAAAARSGLRRADPQPLPPALAGRLYPATWSATRLESAAACAFQQFALHGLRLAPRREARVDPADMGHLLHAALAAFVRGLITDGLDWAELTAEEAAHRREAALAEAAPHVLGRLPQGAARGPLLVAAAARDLAWGVEAMLAHARAGAYQPEGVELEVSLGDVGGRIDRLDRARGADGARHVRVVDYKTGAERFSLEAFFHGLQLQAALYLRAALDEGDRPGGFFLLAVREEMETVPGPEADDPDPPRLRGLAPSDPEALALHERALDGSVTGVRLTKAGIPYKGAPAAPPGGFDLLGRALMRRVAALQRATAAGACAPSPYRWQGEAPCSRCELRPACRFDPGAGDRHRFLRRPPDIWQALEREEAGGDA